MYRKFFGLEKRPFILSPDPEFLYLSKGHDLALTHLEYGVVHNVGFLALTGEVGAGKTTLLKVLFEKVKDSLDVAMLFNTNLDPQAFLEMLAAEYELKPGSREKSALLDALSQHFLDRYTSGRRCVIMVDEAQNMPDETFEELRMLSNLEIGSDFLLQIILVGQPQLRQRLADPALAQLSQRISVYYHLSRLSAEEVGEYIGHRLQVAGYKGKEPLFQDEAVKAIAKASRGIPRIINSICDAALTYAFADEAERVSKELVEKVLEDNEILALSAQASSELEQEADAVKQAAEAQISPKDTAAPAQPSSYDPGAMARMLGRIEAIESRLGALEATEKDRMVEVLQSMLEKEREKNLLLEKRLVAITYKYRALEKRLQDAVRSESSDSTPTARPKKRFWEVFSGSK